MTTSVSTPSVLRARWAVLPGGGFGEQVEVALSAGQIAWVGTEGDPRPAEFADMAVIDLGEVTLIPGLIDSHMHLTFDPTADSSRTQMLEAPAFAATRAAGNAQRALAAGITTVIDCGDHDGVVHQVRDAIDRGVLLGPRVLTAGAPITVTGGHCHWLGGTADSAHEVVVLARTQRARGADFVKLMLTGGNITPGSNPTASQYEDEVLESLAAETHRVGCALVVHAHSEESVRLAAIHRASVVAHGTCRNKNGDGVALSKETRDALLESGTAVDPTITVGATPDENNPTSVRRSELRTSALPVFREMYEAGVPLLAGTDAGVPGVDHVDTPRAVLQLHREVGLDWRAAVDAATAAPAAAFKLPAGALKAGLSADIVAVRGNLSENLDALVEDPIAVWVRGVRAR